MILHFTYESFADRTHNNNNIYPRLQYHRTVKIDVNTALA